MKRKKERKDKQIITGQSDTLPPLPSNSANRKFGGEVSHDTIHQPEPPSFDEQEAEKSPRIRRLEKLSETIGIEGYEITEEIGKGGMGRVYEGCCKGSQERVAIKLLKRDLIDEPRERTRFFREARAIRRIEHPNVVRIFDYGEVAGRPYIVMEYLEGNDLATILRWNKTMPIKNALYIAREVCDALRVAHSQNPSIIHRDIKPHNIFVLEYDSTENDRPRIKVIDFGLAKFSLDQPEAQGLTNTGTILGTPHYVAPETFSSDKIDHRIDVYSLGVTLYEMICGGLPFESNNIFGLLLAHKETLPEAMSKRRPDLDIPEELGQLVLKALAKDPDDRFRSMEEMMRAIEACGIEPKAPEFDYETETKIPKEKKSWLRRITLPIVLAASVAVAGVYHWKGIRSVFVSEAKIQATKTKAKTDSKAEKDKIYVAKIETDLPGVKVYEEQKIEGGTVVSRFRGKTGEGPLEVIFMGERTIYLERNGKRAYFRVTPEDKDISCEMEKRQP